MSPQIHQIMSLPYLKLSKSAPISETLLSEWIESNGLYGAELAEEIIPSVERILLTDKCEGVIHTSSGVCFRITVDNNVPILFFDLESCNLKQRKCREELNALRVYARALNHDLATPMQNIAIQTELLILKGSTDKKVLQSSLVNIRESVFTSQNILSNLGDFARLTMSTDEVCDVNEVLIHVKKVLSQDIANNNAAIAYGAFKNIKIQPFRLLIVLKNLIHNSIKYSGSLKPQILIYETLSEDRYNITVQDNGIGIPTADNSDIFKPYKRASNVGKIEGTGIGLSTCRSLMRATGGDISLNPLFQAFQDSLEPPSTSNSP